MSASAMQGGHNKVRIILLALS